MTLLGFEIEIKFGKGDNKYNNEYLIHVSICKRKNGKTWQNTHLHKILIARKHASLLLNTFLFRMSYSELQYDITRISVIFMKKKMDPFTNIAWLRAAEKNVKLISYFVIKIEEGEGSKIPKNAIMKQVPY